MGRAHHLKRTLPENIFNNLPRSLNQGDPDIEFIVLDYSSRDGLAEWIKTDKDMIRAQERGHLVYARYDDADFFKHSHAKNMAHRLASGDIVCNLDADNFTGSGFASYLQNLFLPDPHNIIVFPELRFHGYMEAGFYGRIAMSRKNFIELGGYKETFEYWGAEDCNLIIRAMAAGLKARLIDSEKYIGVVAHNNMDRILNSSPLHQISAIDRIESLCDEGPTARVLQRQFEERSGLIVCNQGKFGMGTVKKGLDPVSHSIGSIKPYKHNGPCIGGWDEYMKLHL